MQFSLDFLKQYIDIKLSPAKLAELLTMHAFETAIKKENDKYFLDVSVLPNRAHDTFSYWGLAKEIAVLTGKKLKGPLWLASGQVAKLKEDLKLKITDFLNVEVKDKTACPRYIARMVQGVRVGPSPKWLKEKIELAGLRPINNIVDITNFVMLELGQPMHAFDFDKLNANDANNKKKQIIVRRARKGEKITTLDGEDYKFDENVLVIADSKKPIAIAGIKGGKDPEIDKNTVNIILESANFNSALIRRTSRRLNLRTDSSIRFEADLDPNLANIAMERATALIQEISGGKIVKGMIDIYPKKANPYKIGLDLKKVSSVLGVEINEKEAVAILTRLGFEVKKINPLKNVLKLAKSLIGKPYKYGSSVSYDAPNFFDCSSFTSYVYAQSGFQIPRISIDQYFFGCPVKDITAGDLVFSNSMNGNKFFYKSQEFVKGLKIKEGIDHVGIYLGNMKVIHATKKRGGIIIEDLKKSKSFKNFRGARRIIDAAEKFVVTVPSYRKDVRLEEDLIEEIARIYGYEKIKPKPAYAAIVPPQRNENRFWEIQVKNILSGLGFAEIYNYSFVSKKDLENTYYKSSDVQFRTSADSVIELENPVSKDFQYLRPLLIPGILKNVAKNILNFKEIRIFELDKVYKFANIRKIGSQIRENSRFVEKKMLVMAIALQQDSRQAKKDFLKDAREFFELKGAVDLFLNKMGISDIWYDDYQVKPENSPLELWHKARLAEVKVGNEKIGIIGEVSPAVLEKFDVKTRVVLAELDFEKIARLATEEKVYQIFSKYPAVERDIAILTPLDIRIEDVLNVIESAGGPLVVDVDLFDEYVGEEIPQGMKNLAFHIIFQSAEKTLTDEEVDRIYKKIVEAVEENINWEVRK